MSSNAHVAWGVDFGDAENTMEGFYFKGKLGVATYEIEEQFPGLFGFTEEAPERPEGTDHAEWFAGYREPYNERLDAAVPLAFRTYGYEMGGKALVLKRSLTSVEFDCREVGIETLTAPTPAETGAFGAVWGHWRIDWPMNVRLLLMASYG